MLIRRKHVKNHLINVTRTRMHGILSIVDWSIYICIYTCYLWNFRHFDDDDDDQKVENMMVLMVWQKTFALRRHSLFPTKSQRFLSAQRELTKQPTITGNKFSLGWGVTTRPSALMPCATCMRRSAVVRLADRQTTFYPAPHLFIVGSLVSFRFVDKKAVAFSRV